MPIDIQTPPPLSRMRPLHAATHPAVPIALTSQQAIEEQEDVNLPRRSPRFTNQGTAIRRFQSNNN